MSEETLIYIPSEFLKCNTCDCSPIEEHGQEFHVDNCIGRYSIANLINNEFVDMKEVKGFVTAYLSIFFIFIKIKFI